MPKVKIAGIRVGKRIREDNGDVAALAENIREFGLISPIVLRSSGVSYKLLAGHRRLLACQLLGYEEIEAVVR